MAKLTRTDPTQESAAYAARAVRLSTYHLCGTSTNYWTSVGSDIVVRLKWGETEYRGRLVSVDSYMNVQLSECVEYIDGQNKGTLGQVLIRYVSDCARRRSDPG